MSSAEYQRKWRASKGARSGVPGPVPSQPCGTVAAYKRHGRRSEPPCEPCRLAWATYQRDLYARRKAQR